ncbi:Two-component sensor histidine kinase, contains HisKA and HATPase domains [Devosia crocina]|uniref:histidine kinase n=1 Tax=Devosia crocina TaxID=429728 RepID=A0A1I7NPF7_9HYPH|nr:cache domain-containing protein [Devosia crocina]SFV36567.1 Two-component sensor histidine kinase, contains HisKA and HATPase domains [Devosia crocina]
MGEARAIRLTIGLMLTAFVLFVSLLAYFVLQGAGETRTRLEERSRAAVQVVSTNMFWVAELANQTLRRVDAALGPSLAGNSESIEAVLEGLPRVAQIYVLDAQARTIFSTVAGASLVSVADRDYFAALRDGAAFYTSPRLISRLTEDPIFVFSKRIERAGRFSGAIIISFSESLLSDLRNTLDLPEGSAISIAREDGLHMGRSPPSNADIDLNQSPLFSIYLPQADSGTYLATSVIDGVERIVSYARVSGTRIVATASLATAPSWSEFRMAVLALLLIVSPVLIGLFIGCWWILNLLKRLADRNEQLEELNELNTMLFREIHHRIKNNLASVQTLVRMHDLPQDTKRDLESRFAAMAAMHEHIYKHDRYEDIAAADFIPAVLCKVLEAYGSTAEVAFDIADVAVDRDHATPLALLLSELVTNSCKYAFSDGRAGKISVSLKTLREGRATLTFRDNGPGLSQPAGTTSMGMRIIRGAVTQMGGTFQFQSDQGLTFHATLDLHPERAPQG